MALSHETMDAVPVAKPLDPSSPTDVKREIGDPLADAIKELRYNDDYNHLNNTKSYENDLGGFDQSYHDRERSSHGRKFSLMSSGGNSHLGNRPKLSWKADPI